MSVEDNKRVAIESFRLIETGDIVMADRIVAVDFINREADDDKQSERLERGPAGFLATSRWLRGIFSDLRFHEIEAIGEGDLVAVKATMAGRHTGEFQGVAPSSKLIRQRQIHISGYGTASSWSIWPSATISACCCRSAGGGRRGDDFARGIRGRIERGGYEKRAGDRRRMDRNAAQRRGSGGRDR